VLASDGSDLAAAVQTILEIGAAEDMEDAIADAFPAARVEVVSTDGYFELEMHQHGLVRPLKPQNCPMVRCATYCWWARCSRRGRRR
jgi:predicted ATPase